MDYKVYPGGIQKLECDSKVLQGIDEIEVTQLYNCKLPEFVLISGNAFK